MSIDWTVYFANTQFKKILKIRCDMKPPNPPILGTPVYTRFISTLSFFVTEMPKPSQTVFNVVHHSDSTLSSFQQT